MTATSYSFVIVIEKEGGNGDYTAYSPTLPGCFTRGKTLEETRRRIREAIEERVQALLAEGQAIRQSEDLIHVEALTITVAQAPGNRQGSLDGRPGTQAGMPTENCCSRPHASGLISTSYTAARTRTSNQRKKPS